MLESNHTRERIARKKGARKKGFTRVCCESHTLSLRFVGRARRVTEAQAPTNICKMDFANKPRLTGELNEVPGLGEVGINTLNHKGIKTTYQVIGKYLEVRKGGSNRA